jgi:hypothetical protein
MYLGMGLAVNELSSESLLEAYSQFTLDIPAPLDDVKLVYLTVGQTAFLASIMGCLDDATAVRAALDMYCQSGNEPSQFMATVVGICKDTHCPRYQQPCITMTITAALKHVYQQGALTDC